MISEVYNFFWGAPAMPIDMEQTVKLFIEKNQLPEPNRGIDLDRDGNIHMYWFPSSFGVEEFRIPRNESAFETQIEIVLRKNGTGYAYVDWFYPGWGDDPHIPEWYDLGSLGLQR